MAPSRGLRPLLRTRIPALKPHARRYSEFVAAATDPSQKARVFVSQSQDPYLNLSIEHYLLQRTPGDSTILFLYTNSPCVVIGRNQNPWIEVNLGVLRNEELGVKLVRRRSGGGTVFHDEGNMNYSVICPPSEFNRDKHAEMVVRALKSLGTEKARVNERHDIVVDKEDKEGALKPFKVSGSAYKLTRLRSLHHGTCLLSSPNLESISKYLRAPAKPLIKARGVDSVSSPIANVGIDNFKFQEAVAFEFRSLYGTLSEASVWNRSIFFVDEKAKEVPEIAYGLEELMSEDWIYCQTPQFKFSTKNITETDSVQSIPSSWPPALRGCKIEFTAKHGKFTEVSVDYNDRTASSEQIELPLLNKLSFHYNGLVEHEKIESNLMSRELHKITDWEQLLPPFLFTDSDRNVAVSPGRTMNQLFGMGNYEPSAYVRE